MLPIGDIRKHPSTMLSHSHVNRNHTAVLTADCIYQESRTTVIRSPKKSAYTIQRPWEICDWILAFFKKVQQQQHGLFMPLKTQVYGQK